MLFFSVFASVWGGGGGGGGGGGSGRRQEDRDGVRGCLFRNSWSLWFILWLVFILAVHIPASRRRKQETCFSKRPERFSPELLADLNQIKVCFMD